MVIVSKIIDELSSDVDQVYRILREYNRSQNPDWFATGENPKFDPEPLNLIARLQDGTVLGGLTATTSLAWLKVSIMAVDDANRRRGVGRQLLNACHEEAVHRGCRYSFLDTMDYQAPGFYQRMGYELISSIPDWDSFGHSKCFFTKTL